MKNFYGWVVFLFCLLLVLFKVDAVTTEHQMQVQMQKDKARYEAQVQAMEQEIRLMKQDLAIIYGGWIDKGEFEEE